MFPDDVMYTPEHEWVRPADAVNGAVRVGITHYAQDALGDIVFVSLPEVGEIVRAGEVCGELESTKSVSDVFAPAIGEVTARNGAFGGDPELVNNDPYGEGWLIELIPAGESSLDTLMDAAAYQASLEG